MGPEFDSNEEHNTDWGEDSIDHEAWDDDPEAYDTITDKDLENDENWEDVPILSSKSQAIELTEEEKNEFNSNWW